MQSEVLLRFFEQVRQRLVTAGIRELAGDWDIREENEPGLLGYCHTTQLDEWVAISDDTKVAPFRVDYVGIRLVPEDSCPPARSDEELLVHSSASSSSESSSASVSSDQCHSSSGPDRYSSSERYYPLETLLPTLLHEFAHVLAPCCLRLSSATGRRSRQWQPDSHGPEFYQAFARVLRVAEELAIFALPNTANKLSRKSLSRFDRIDLESFQLSAATVLPQSRQLFAAGEQLDPNLEPPPVYPLRLTFAATVKGRTAQKPVVIDAPMSWQQFLRFAKDKLNMARLPTSVRDHSGALLDESGVQRLSRDQKLVFTSRN